MAEVRVEGVWKRYGEVVAVRDMNLTCHDGEFLALVGPSGCGKSSTLRMIAGLEEISEGRIYLDGEVVNDLPPPQRNVAMAFETYALYPPLTVYENIAYPLRVRKFPKREINKKVRAVTQLLEIEDLLHLKPFTLSGGQQQRVSLSRALVREPRVSLLDEPISHLDTRQRVRLRARIRHLHDTLAATTIYVTHNQEEAVSLADRVVVMNEGRLQQVGTAEEIFNSPANHFVAGFIGDPPMNFLSGVVKNRAQLLLTGTVFPLPKSIEVEGKVVVGIRPNEIGVHFEKPNRPALLARVEVLEPLGDYLVITVAVDGVEMKVVAAPQIGIEDGQSVWLVPDPERIHLFDLESGEAVR